MMFSNKRTLQVSVGRWIFLPSLLTFKNKCSIIDVSEEYKEEIKELIDSIENEKLLDFLLGFIKSAIKRWG